MNQVNLIHNLHFFNKFSKHTKPLPNVSSFVGKNNAFTVDGAPKSRFDKTTKKQHLVMHSDSSIFTSFDYFDLNQSAKCF